MASKYEKLKRNNQYELQEPLHLLVKCAFGKDVESLYIYNTLDVALKCIEDVAYIQFLGNEERGYSENSKKGASACVY